MLDIPSIGVSRMPLAWFLTNFPQLNLARILLGDATDPICKSVFQSRGHEVELATTLKGFSFDATLGLRR